ncbi:hypothetical protein V9T40_004899 [Parthenolecanium corni]|uniref:Uncharacterized protein n=1 Tax=Parthenolecanium corni TaxID=536013 RepID=A0AAN9Y263_9HEMI
MFINVYAPPSEESLCNSSYVQVLFAYLDFVSFVEIQSFLEAKILQHIASVPQTALRLEENTNQPPSGTGNFSHCSPPHPVSCSTCGIVSSASGTFIHLVPFSSTNNV